MAEDIFEEVLRNRDAYPDDRTIQVGDRTITVKEFRDRWMPKSEFTRASQTWSEERSRLSDSLTGLQRQLAAEIEARQSAGTMPMNGDGSITREQLARDPVMGLIIREIDQVRRDMMGQQQTYGRDQYLTKIRELKSRDTELNERDLIDYAVKRQIVDMDVAYRDFTRERDIERAVKKAKEEGIEEGKRTARLPHVPTGGKRAPSSPAPEPKFGDVDSAMQDPDILAALNGEAST